MSFYLRDDETLALTPPARQIQATTTRSGTRYRILEEIARGGMGVVYRVRDPEMNRVLALKVLRPDHADNPAMQWRFLEEARIAGGLQHPGIVPIHDIGRLTDDRPYFLMKLVEGQTLASLLAQRETVSDELLRFLWIFEQICQTVAYAHACGVIHRDLKPGNIMVGAFGEVQVMDWGLAKRLACEDRKAHEDVLFHSDASCAPTCAPTSLLSSNPARESQDAVSLVGSILGTPAYMAPEQARPGNVDCRADVFGLGAILCEILTGMPPFLLTRTQAGSVLDQKRDLTEVQERLNHCMVDQELVVLAKSCLAEDPDDRPAHAGMVAAQMTAYRAGVAERLRTAELERASALARSRSDRRARRALGGLTLVAVLLVTLVVSIASFWHARQQATNHRVESLLADASRLEQQASTHKDNDMARESWREGLANLERAEEVLRTGPVNPQLREAVTREASRVREEIRQLDQDRHFLESLVDIRIHKDDDDARSIDTETRYRSAFQSRGLDIDREPTAVLASRILARPSGVQKEILSALDDWMQERRNKNMPEASWRPLLLLASAIDDSTWRQEVRAQVLSASEEWPRSRYLARDLVGVLAGGQAVLAEQLLVSGVEIGQRRARLCALADRANPDHLAPSSIQLLASLLWQEGHPARTVSLLIEGQRRHPGDVWLAYDLGRALLAVRPARTEEAIRHLAAVRALRPEIGHTLAHALLRKNETAEAIDLFQDLIRMRPSNTNHLFCLARALRRCNRLQEAEATIRQGLAITPRSASFLTLQGTILLDQGKGKEAELVLQEALKQDPDNLDAQVQLARFLIDNGNPDAGATMLERAQARTPSEASVAFYLGRARTAQRRTKEAIQLYRVAIALSPSFSEARTNLAVLLDAQGKTSEALAHLQQAILDDPAQRQARRFLGILFCRRKAWREAIPHLQRALEQCAEDSEAGLLLAMAHDQLGDLASALQVHEDLARRFPRHAIVAYEHGHLLDRLRRPEQAIVRYRQAIAALPIHAEAHCNLGLALRKLGKFQEGLAALERGHELGQQRSQWDNPSSIWVHQQRALVEVESHLPDLLSGRRKPRNLEEWGFASMACYFKGLHRSRVRFLLDTFADSPHLERDRSTFDRMGAACSAVLAGTGAARDGGTLTATERLAYRLQALTWLTSELRYWKQRAGSNDPALVGQVRENVQNWLVEHDLAAVREPELLARLTLEERQAWAAFWEAVRQLSTGEKS